MNRPLEKIPLGWNFLTIVRFFGPPGQQINCPCFYLWSWHCAHGHLYVNCNRCHNNIGRKSTLAGKKVIWYGVDYHFNPGGRLGIIPRSTAMWFRKSISGHHLKLKENELIMTSNTTEMLFIAYSNTFLQKKCVFGSSLRNFTLT